MKHEDSNNYLNKLLNNKSSRIKYYKKNINICKRNKKLDLNEL